MDKKGFGPETLAKWLLAVVVVVALVILAIQVYNSWGAGKHDPATCRASVELHYRTKLPYLGSESPFNLKCETKKETSETLVKREILEDIARDMYDCWWEFGEGEINFLSDVDWFGSDTYCRVCSIRRFSSRGYNGAISIDELDEFLDTEKIPTGKITYSEFFTKVENGKLDFGEGEIMIDPQNNFYVFFMAHKESEFWRDLLGGDVVQEEVPVSGAVGTKGVFVARRLVKEAGKEVAKKAGTRIMGGPIGVVLVSWDVYALGARATEYFPALVIQSGAEAARNALKECDDLG